MEQIPKIQTEPSELHTIEKPPVRTDPIKRFYLALYGQLEESYEMDHKKPNGEIIKIPCGRMREDAKEFITGLTNFLKEAEKAVKRYQSSELYKKLGSQYHDGNYFSAEQMEEVQEAVEEGDGISGSKIGDGALRNAFLAFDLYTCIKTVKPNKIITLANGALRLDALTQALGFKSENYLAIHRSTHEEHRRDLPSEIIYEGEPIAPHSTVLLLEDTSSFQDERTYQKARAWLTAQGVTNSPVFMEYVTELQELAIVARNQDIEQFIKVQEELNRENCYNSFAAGYPDKNSDFWTKTKSKLTEIEDVHPELYESFFKLIREHK